jgi:hypothetical protein
MQKGSELCDDEAPFAVFAVVAANYQRSVQRSPRESWAADARRTTEQRHARYYVRCFPLFLETSARRMIAYSHGHNYIKPEAFCQFDTCHFRIYLDRHYPSLLSLASELSV